MIVVDANILSFYVIEGERTADANILRTIDPEWIVPAFWSIEFQSILSKYVRSGGMSLEKALDLLDYAGAVFSANEITPASDTTLRDAINWGITVYDSQYASLAKRLGIQCVTEDKHVQESCRGIAVSLKDFISGKSGPRVIREPGPIYQVRRRRRK